MKGDLSRVGLPGLVQMLCAERRRLALHLHRTGEEGAIYIDRGVIVHANLGHAQGESAFLELTTWAKGSFHVVQVEHTPPPTIATLEGSTEHLVMEAIRRNESTRRTLPMHQDKPLSKAAFAADQALEQRLLTAVGEAERGGESLRSDKVRHQPALAIEIMTEMVNQFAELASSVTPEGARPPSMKEVLAAATVSHEALSLAELEGYRISTRSALAFHHTPARDAVDRHRFFHELVLGLASMVDDFCTRLAGFFSYPEMAEEWTEVSHVFVFDLKQALESLEF